jgi:hypothetical protein
MFSEYSWRRHGRIHVPIRGALPVSAYVEHAHLEAYVKQLNSARGLLEAATDELMKSDVKTVYHGKDTAPESSELLKIIHFAEHELRTTIRTQPKEEKEVQEAFENILLTTHIAHQRESVRIPYSSKDYVPDFTFDKIDLAIDLKLCHHDKRREKQIIAEINDDIMAYKTKYGNLLFIVYDIGQIKDVDKFKGNFEAHEGVVVIVVKH